MSTAISLNTETFSFTGYTSYEFDGLLMFNGTPISFNSSGVYKLEGTDDDGTAIAWEFMTGSTDLDTDRKKNVTQIHVDGTGTFDVLVRVNEIEYTVTYDGVRAKPGRGLKGTRWGFGLTGTGPATINSIEPTMQILDRRE